MTTIHSLRVSLKPRISRDIEIRSTASLYALAEAIVSAFDFSFDHAFGFFGSTDVWRSTVRYELFPDIGLGEDDSKSVKRTKVEQAFPSVGSKMTFLFDYGDEWHFNVRVIEIREPEPNVKYPRLVKMVGDAPPQYGDPEDDEC